MSDVPVFAVVVAVVSAAVLVAVFSNRLGAVLRVPSAAIFLVGAAIVSDLVPRLATIPITVVQRVVTVCLIFILFDGGMHIGWRRLRPAAGAVTWLGVAGTLVTAGGAAAIAHWMLGLAWFPALLIGTALAPTDPAVVFSVLGRREIKGRTGTILEGESGANDPVGIALMIALIGSAGVSSWHAVGVGVGTFALEMAVGLVIGAAGGYLLQLLMRRVALPNDALSALRTLACATLVYGVATFLHGSGFLAVFLAGIFVGDIRAPYKPETERLSGAVASLSEIVAFTVLGLTVSLNAELHGHDLLPALALALLLIVVVRPVLVGLVLLPIRLRIGERAFVLLAGLKGAVPILLGTFALGAGVPEAARIYRIIFVVVLVSVVLQGGLAPTMARLLHVPMREVEPAPWALGMRFREQPQGLQRYVIRAGARADGSTIADLPIEDRAWISMVSRSGELLQVRGDTTLHAGDEVLVLADPDDEHGLALLFTRRH
ncbi:MAG TPA: cation:proton antiporter [Nocardioidaceae bacterium]|nr:cation:proton antiporter [Nocardioidaceae bacterium]